MCQGLKCSQANRGHNRDTKSGRRGICDMVFRLTVPSLRERLSHDSSQPVSCGIEDYAPASHREMRYPWTDMSGTNATHTDTPGDSQPHTHRHAQ